MKHTLFLILISATFFISCSTKQDTKQNTEVITKSIETDLSPDGIVIQAQANTDTLKGSLQAYASGKIGDVNVLIEYYSPAVRGRIIWGGLVPLNQVWVTGAHMATAITFNAPLVFNGIEVPAGKYAFFTIPSEHSWTIILNTNWKQHLADKYNSSEDVLRFSVDAHTIDTHQERLRYVIESNTISVHWDKVKVDIPVSDNNSF